MKRKKKEELQNEYSDFMFKLSQKDFATLDKNVGNWVIVNYVMNGTPKNVGGVLNYVKPFNCVAIKDAPKPEIPFVDKDIVIRQITDTENNMLYDRSFFVSKYAENTGDVRLARMKLLGTMDGKTKDFSAITKTEPTFENNNI